MEKTMTPTNPASRRLLCASALLVVFAACGDDDATLPLDAGGSDSSMDTASPPDAAAPLDTGGEDAPMPECAEDTDPTLAGVARPIDDFEFRNAFDPSDETIYDPDVPAALVAPVMVDTWGDRTSGAHGTLGVFPPGFVAPPHVHTAGYEGVVIRGEMTNPFGTELEVLFDANEGNDHGSTRLPPGSYWNVPAQGQHTTTCVGPEVCWFYFYSESAFDFEPMVGEDGQLLDGVVLENPTGAVEMPRDELTFVEAAPFVQFAAASGSMAAGPHGSFGLFRAGAASPVHVHGAEYHGVVITGVVTNPFNGAPNSPRLTQGGYWSVPADSSHVTACEDGEECLFFFHQRVGFDFTPLCQQP